ncbi:YlbF family regulator [Enterococcus sp. LJL90]
MLEDKALQVELDKLTTLIEENEIIIRFRQIEKRVNDNQQLAKLVEEIKEAQKAAVQYEHYDKPEAKRQALALADQLTAEFDNHPLVIAYREQLVEANDLLQHLTHKIQKSVNDALEESAE